MDNLKFINDLLLKYKKGGIIKIKSKNIGKFTKYCDGKVTQTCIDKAKKSNNQTLIKRAIFAENARKWKHLNGGSINFLDNLLRF